ncbi:PA14 domain-containing protein [Mycobacteroides saopaulense]|uniref:PA14 domain-containing protein n=1 Tax=Mycobacteroides saopaulense TaxID=1578165 RepID=UPI0012FF86A8|nr:PA14 domain-containing protein [Mycobacteroides saopaulense]
MRGTALLLAFIVLVSGCVPARPQADAAAHNPCDVGQYWTRYYNNTDQSGTAVLARCEYSVGGNFAGSPTPGVNADRFSADATGSLRFPVTGQYQIASMSGGVMARVWLDDEQIFDHANTRDWGTDLATRTVEAGVHTVRVSYSSTSGPAVQEFSVSRAGPGPMSANGNYFAANSFLNQPLPSNPAVDPRSPNWVAALVNHPDVKAIDVNEDIWTTAVYHAPAGTPTRTVTVRNSGKSIEVPYLPHYRPTQDTDAHIAIIDDTSGCEYEFQSFKPDSMSAIAQATYRVDIGSGGHVSGPAHSGGELSYLAGLITPEDVQAGVIDHALRFAIPINAPTYVYPGTRSDGTVAGGVPEGIRIQLDPSLDLRTWNLSPFQRMVATALQKYGAFDADVAKTFSLTARSVIDGSRYSTRIDDLPRELIGHLRFLTPSISSTDIQLDTAADGGCRQQR